MRLPSTGGFVVIAWGRLSAPPPFSTPPRTAPPPPPLVVIVWIQARVLVLLGGGSCVCAYPYGVVTIHRVGRYPYRDDDRARPLCGDPTDTERSFPASAAMTEPAP
jgi:hypothetical protein